MLAHPCANICPFESLHAPFHAWTSPLPHAGTPPESGSASALSAGGNSHPDAVLFRRFRCREVTACGGTFPDVATSLLGLDTRIGSDLSRTDAPKHHRSQRRIPKARHLQDPTLRSFRLRHTPAMPDIQHIFTRAAASGGETQELREPPHPGAAARQPDGCRCRKMSF